MGRRIVQQDAGALAGGDMALVHRLGHLGVGDVSVAVAWSCPHRAQAFDAAATPSTGSGTGADLEEGKLAAGTRQWVHPGT